MTIAPKPGWPQSSNPLASEAAEITGVHHRTHKVTHSPLRREQIVTKSIFAETVVVRIPGRPLSQSTRSASTQNALQPKPHQRVMLQLQQHQCHNMRTETS